MNFLDLLVGRGFESLRLHFLNSLFGLQKACSYIYNILKHKDMKKQLSIYQIVIILGAIVSLVLQVMRITGHVDMSLLQTLIPAAIPYMALAGTFAIAYISGFIKGLLEL